MHRFFVVLFAISLGSVIACGFTYAILAVNCRAGITDSLREAAQSQTPEDAILHLNSVIEYMEENELTYGYTSIVTPDETENLETWYKKVVSVRDQIDNMPDSISIYEKAAFVSFVMGNIVSCRQCNFYSRAPEGISVYPYNKLLSRIFLFSTIICFVSAILVTTIFEY